MSYSPLKQTVIDALTLALGARALRLKPDISDGDKCEVLDHASRIYVALYRSVRGNRSENALWTVDDKTLMLRACFRQAADILDGADPIIP